MVRSSDHGLFTPIIALNMQLIKSNTETVGAVIDYIGYDAIEFCVHTGTITDGSYTIKVYQGKKSDMSDATLVEKWDLRNADFVLTASDSNTIRNVGCMGDGYFFRINIVSNGCTDGGNIGIIAILSEPHKIPAPNQFTQSTQVQDQLTMMISHSQSVSSN